MNVAIGSDHAGWALKEFLKGWLIQAGYQVQDFGTHSPDAVDYPDYGVQVAEAVSIGKADRGLLICGTGIGMTITANKVSGVRAALCSDLYTARMSREHNDANVLVLGGRLTGNDVAREILEMWFSAGFAGGRHGRRVEKIREIDERHRRPEGEHLL